MRKAVVCTISTIVVGMSLGSAAQQAGQRNRGMWFTRDYSQFIFYAVLEGCYEDGVSSAVIDAIIPPQTQSPDSGFNHSFVYACPLCHPAYEAMRRYRAREPFMGQKTPDPAKRVSTFGPGLSKELQKKLMSADARTQHASLQELIRTWVERRVNRLRLTDDERATLAKGIEEGRKEGAEMLAVLKKDAEEKGRSVPQLNWMNCAVCDGSFGACQKQPSPFAISPVASPAGQR